jgi:serine/threonine protein phosphatase PrpC
VLSMFVADGAGSAKCGGEGAELAIQAGAAFLGKHLEQAEFGLSDEWAVRCVISVRERIYSRAAETGKTARDYACTFLALVALPMATLVFQVGDGGIVLDVGSGLEVAVQPMTGEYVNMTHL